MQKICMGGLPIADRPDGDAEEISEIDVNGAVLAQRFCLLGEFGLIFGRPATFSSWAGGCGPLRRGAALAPDACGSRRHGVRYKRKLAARRALSLQRALAEAGFAPR